MSDVTQTPAVDSTVDSIDAELVEDAPSATQLEEEGDIAAEDRKSVV